MPLKAVKARTRNIILRVAVQRSEVGGEFQHRANSTERKAEHRAKSISGRSMEQSIVEVQKPHPQEQSLYKCSTAIIVAPAIEELQ